MSTIYNIQSLYISYLNICDILQLIIVNKILSKQIIKTKYINPIINRKIKYFQKIIIDNSSNIYKNNNAIQTLCYHLLLLSSTNNNKNYTKINNPQFIQKCIFCNLNIINYKNEFYNGKETKWKHFLRLEKERLFDITNKNIQHGVLIRQNLNTSINIMNLSTKTLNRYFDYDAFSYRRFNIIRKLTSIHFLIISYCDNKSLFMVNKSWDQFFNKYKNNIIKQKNLKRKIDECLVDNEIITTRINNLKKKIKCNHSFISSKIHNTTYCTKCKIINSTESIHL